MDEKLKNQIIGSVKFIKRSKDAKGIGIMMALYKNAYADGANDLTKGIEKAIKGTHGVGEVLYNRITENIMEQFEHHEIIEVLKEEDLNE